MSRNYDDETAQVTPDEPVVVRDRRKIDPDTGELRQQTDDAGAAIGRNPPAADSPGVADPAAPAADGEAERQLAERTADLQRVQAEYANYRKRVERDRETVAASAKASVTGELLPLLDDIERAESHGDLTGAFKAVADNLVATLHSAGLESYGTEGEPFDPSVHEAVQHTTSPEVAEPTVTAVLRRGYRFGERVLRPAMVAVTDHEPAEQPQGPDVLVDPAEPVGGPAPDGDSAGAGEPDNGQPADGADADPSTAGPATHRQSG